MNKLCISKLLQVIEQDLIPTERTAGSTPNRTKPVHQPQQQTQPIGGPATIGASSQPIFRSASGF
jgi:hypothetical protein